MKHDLSRTVGQVPYPPHPDTEYEGHPPEDAASTELAVRNAIATISEIMVEDRRRRGSETLPELAPQVEMEAVAPRARRGHGRRAGAAPPAQGQGLLARLGALRPKTQHVGWAIAFGAVLLWPKAVLITAFALFCLTLTGFALFGPARMSDLRDRVRRVGDIGLPVSGGVAWRGLLRRAPDDTPDVFAGRPDPYERIAKDP